MLDFLTSNNTKKIIGLSLTPGIGLEAAIYNRYTGALENYAKRNVEYDLGAREARDWNQFKTATAELLQEIAPNIKNPQVYVVLPNIFFDFQSFSADLDNAIIQQALYSYAEERAYIFKSTEPIVGYVELANPDNIGEKKLAISAFQKSVIAELKDIASELKFKLIGVETSYSATLRGLKAAGLINDVCLEEASWSAIVIHNNSFTIFNMDGTNLINCIEEPLAIKSYSQDEAYQVIASRSIEHIASYNPSKLYIISQTDEISSNTLKNMLQFDNDIITIDINRFSETNIINVAQASDYAIIKTISLAVIGAAYPNPSDMDMTINVLADDPTAINDVYCIATIFGQQVEITNEFVQKAVLTIIILAGLIIGCIAGIFTFLSNSCQNEIDSIKRQSDQLQQEINRLTPKESKQEVDMNQIIDNTAQKSIMAINFYDSISSDIPKNVWLTKYYNINGDKIVVRGIAQSIVDIYEYYKNLRIISPQSDIKLNDIKVITDDAESEDRKYLNNLVIDKDTDRLYSFMISNTELKVSDEDSNNSQQQNPNNSQNASSSSVPQNIEQPSKQMVPAK